MTVDRSSSHGITIDCIQAPLGRPEPLVYPLGLATLAGSLPSHHAVRLIDPNLIGVEKTIRLIRDNTPDIICLSIRNLDSQIRRDLFYYYMYLKTFIRQVRSVAPHSVIIAGGSGFSLFPYRIMVDNPDVDRGVFLEADRILPDLIESLHTPEAIRGVYYRVEDRIVYTGDPDLPVPDDFGRPRYDLLDPKPYEANGGVGIQTKRGCPLHCIYCTYPHLNGACLRMVPVERIIDEMKELEHRYGVREITFVDGVFNIPTRRTEALLRAKLAAGLQMRWRAWFTEKGFTREFAELCRDAGCPEFSFSPDGFSSTTLKALGKTISVEDIQRVFEIARETPGIRVAFNFFWNPPGQTLKTWFRMIRFAVRCKLILRKKAGGIIFSNARIEPNTPLHALAIDDGVIDTGTDLLPETADQLKRLFYSNRSTRVLDVVYDVYSCLWKFRRFLRRK
ncbi:radical SAM protein [bacterium]|nr:radical SAM protein [candidate division CSSED10-310 bacterium]